MKAIFFSLFTFLFLTAYSQQPASIHLRHFMQAAPSPANQVPYGANPQAGRYANAGDAKIYYEVYGTGQTLVILHGGIFGSTYEMFRFIDSLKEHYQVIAVSTRGHGKSELGTQPITYEQKAADVMAVINAVTNDSVTVLGFSDGGYTGFKLASKYPNRIKKLIAIGATELRPGLRDFAFDAKQGVALDTAYWNQQFKLMPEPQRLQEMFTKLGNMYDRLTLNKEFFQTIKCPTLVIAGDRDPGNPVQRVVSTAQMLPHSQVGIIPNTTHGVFLENFDAVWACITPFLLYSSASNAQVIKLAETKLQPVQVSMSIEQLHGKQVVRVIKDSSVKTFDQPTFVRIKDIDFKNGTIEVNVLSRLLPNAPAFARGFIGIAFRINDDNTKFESVYIRPSNGRANNQLQRNHSIQYFSYPGHDFERLRNETPGLYEAYADMGLNEWIKMKIVIKGAQAKLFLNGSKQPSLIVNDLKHGAGVAGAIGLWVDAGTEGFFSDLKIYRDPWR